MSGGIQQSASTGCVIYGSNS